MAKKKSNNEDRLKKMNSGERYNTGLTQRFNVLGPELATQKKNNKNSKLNAHSSVKNVAKGVIRSGVGDKKFNNSSALERAYRRYEAFTTGRDFGEINSYYNKTGKSAYSIENGRFVRNPSFRRDVDYNQYNRSPYRPMEKWERNEDNYWGYGTFDKWIKGKNTPKYSDTNYWEEGTPQSDMWHSFHDYQDPNWERDEEIYQSLKGEDKEKWAQHNASHFKLYENEGAFRKDKANEIRKAEQRFLYGQYLQENQTPEERQKWHDENYATHHNERNVLDRIFGPLMNNTAAQIAYAHATGGSKLQAFKDSLKYMNPFTDDVSGRKYWSDVFDANTENLRKKGGTIAYSPSGSPFAPIQTMDADDIASDRVSNSLAGLLFDIGTDPLTYLGGGVVGGASKVLKGSGAVKAELEADRVAENIARASGRSRSQSERIVDMMNAHVTLDDAIEIVQKDNVLLKNKPKTSERLARDLLEKVGNNVYGINGKDSKVYKIRNREFSPDKILRKIGDKTVAPYFNVANRKLRSTLGTLTSENAQYLRLAAKEGDQQAFKSYFNKLLVEDNYSIADRNVKAFERLTDPEGAFTQFFNNATDEEKMAFIASYDNGDFKHAIENERNVIQLRKKAAEKFKGDPELLKQLQTKEKQLDSMEEAMRNMYHTVSTEMDYSYGSFDSLIARRNTQLNVLREMERAGIEVSGAGDLYKQLVLMNNNKELFQKYGKEIYKVFDAPVYSLSIDDALSAKYFAQSLDDITKLTGADVDWGEIASIYADLHSESAVNVAAFRNGIQKRLGGKDLSNYIKGSIAPDELTEAVNIYKNRLVDRQIDNLFESGKLEELFNMTAQDASTLSRSEKTLWNILNRNNTTVEMSDMISRIMAKEGVSSNVMSGLREIVENLTKYEKPGQLLRAIDNFESSITYLSPERRQAVDAIETYLRNHADSITDYNINNIAKSLNREEVVKSYKNLEDEIAALNESIGSEVEAEISNYVQTELMKTTNLDSESVSDALKLLDGPLRDDATRAAYQAFADNCNNILYEEYQLGEISKAEYERLKNVFTGREINTDLIDNFEYIFGEPFSDYEKLEGKYTPVHGKQHSYVSRQHRDVFATMKAGEEAFESACLNRAKYNFYSSLSDETKNNIVKAISEKSRTDVKYITEMDVYNYAATHMKDLGGDLEKELSLVKEKAKTFYNYNIQQVFLNKAIQHNKLVQSDLINNFVKNQLTTKFDPKVGKTSDKIIIPYIDMMKDCEKIYYASEQAKKNLGKYIESSSYLTHDYGSPQAVFNKVISDVGINPDLVGMNVSHFEVNASQLETIKKTLYNELNPEGPVKRVSKNGKEYMFENKLATDGYNMDKVTYNTLNTYTKAQMKTMQNTLLNLYDGFLTKFKVLNTIINPGFHGQNAPSNAFQSFLAVGEDAFNPVKIKRAYEIVRNGDPLKKVTFGGQTKTCEQWRNILMQYNVVDNTFYNDFKYAENVSKAQMREVTMEEFNNFAKNDFEGKLSFLNPIADAVNKPFQVAGKVGVAIEGTQRANLFFSLIDKGYNYREAVEGVNKFLFDYGDLTKAERSFFRRVIPFYSFLRKNLPMELEMMLEQPQKFVNTRRVFDSVSRMSEDYIPPDERNEWRDTDIQLPFRINGEYYGLADNMPYTQFEKWSDGGKILGQTSPLVKLLPELLTGKYAYTGMDIESPSSYIMNQIPALKTIERYAHDKHFGLNPPDADPDYEPDYTRGAMWGLGQLTGFPINRVERQEYNINYPDRFDKYAEEPGVIEDLLNMIRQRSISEVRNKE